MSGIKDPHVAAFLRLVRERFGKLGGLRTVCDLASLGRSHVSQVLNGRNDRNGAFTWQRLRRHVTGREWHELEQSSAWNTFRAENPTRAAEALLVPLVDDAAHPLMPVVCCVCGKGITVKSCAPLMAGLPSHTYCQPCMGQRLVIGGKPVLDDTPPAVGQTAELNLTNDSP